MKRYEPQIIYPRDGSGPKLSFPEKWDGSYSLASEAQAEIDRLRALVEAAYREGCGVLCIESQEDEDVAWEKSDARKAMGAE